MTTTTRTTVITTTTTRLTTTKATTTRRTTTATTTATTTTTTLPHKIIGEIYYQIENTTTPLTTTTPAPEQCYSCHQETAYIDGTCWDPSKASTQMLDVCEHGCYQKFAQVKESSDAPQSITTSEIIRSCAGKLSNIQYIL